MIRDNKRILDIQNCIFQLLEYLSANTAPWTSWEIVLGYPESEIFEKFTKPFIYVESPVPTGKKWHQAGEALVFYESIIGLWTDRQTGGEEEVSIMASYLFDLFSDPGTLHASVFDVTTDAVYTGTNLVTQGIRVREIGNFNNVPTEDEKEFRKEATISILA